MSIVLNLSLLSIAVLIVVEAVSPPAPKIQSNLLHNGVPTYHVDPHILKLGQDRYKQCGLHYAENDGEYSKFAFLELQFLYHQHSASEYFRGHELLAYQFYVEHRHQNPFYRENRLDAALEYIPILTLPWKAKVEKESPCSYASFIQFLWSIWKYIQSRDGLSTADVMAGKSESQQQKQLPIKFFVSSTFNMRTEWGKGMSSANRKGDEWDSISAFVMSLCVGHYERWPECPDLLRKWWKYVVELPYLDISLSALQSYDISSIDSKKIALTATHRIRTSSTGISLSSSGKRYNFLFTGNFELPGPERVCSVRNSLLSIASREDTLIVNVTLADSYNRGVSGAIQQLITKSFFCIISSGQSYSTAFFYHAIQNDCIPIVIDDWFTFSFPWLVNYELFVIRINEEDFKMNPNVVLDYILKRFKGFVKSSSVKAEDDDINNISDASTNHVRGNGYHHMKILDLMRLEMRKAKQLLSFESYSYSNYIPGGLEMKQYKSVLALEHMMLELVYAQQPHYYFNNIPCYRYYMCKPYTPQQLASITADPKNMNSTRDYIFINNKVDKIKLMSTVYSDIHPEEVVIYNNIFHANKRRPIQLHNDNYQASALYIPEKNLRETRSHLCRNSKRLIGQYKMVYFMQCVRVLWPLSPGKFRNADNEARFSKPNYDEGSDNGPGIRKYDRDFVLAFHNLGNQEMIGGSWTNVIMYPANETAMSYIKSLHDVEIMFPQST